MWSMVNSFFGGQTTTPQQSSLNGDDFVLLGSTDQQDAQPATEATATPLPRTDDPVLAQPIAANSHFITVDNIQDAEDLKRSPQFNEYQTQSGLFEAVYKTIETATNNDFSDTARMFREFMSADPRNDLLSSVADFRSKTVTEADAQTLADTLSNSISSLSPQNHPESLAAARFCLRRIQSFLAAQNAQSAQNTNEGPSFQLGT